MWLVCIAATSAKKLKKKKFLDQWEQCPSRFQQWPTACRYIFSCQSRSGRARWGELSESDKAGPLCESQSSPARLPLCSRRDLAFTGSLYVTNNKAKGYSEWTAALGSACWRNKKALVTIIMPASQPFQLWGIFFSCVAAFLSCLTELIWRAAHGSWKPCESVQELRAVKLQPNPNQSKSMKHWNIPFT